VACIARGRRLSPQPECPTRQLCRTIPCRPACRNLGDRRNGELPGQSTDEQGTTDAMVSTRRRPATAGSVRRLQRHAWIQFQPSLRADIEHEPTIRDGGLIPPISGHSPKAQKLPSQISNLLIVTFCTEMTRTPTAISRRLPWIFWAPGWDPSQFSDGTIPKSDRGPPYLSGE
jgi:hypothetical protein